MELKLKFDVDMDRTAHYVKQQCGKPVIGRLLLRNEGSETLRGVTVTVDSVTDGLALPVTTYLKAVPAGGIVEIPEAKKLLLNSEFLRKPTAKLSTEIVFSVTREGETLYSEARELAVMPMDYWENDPHFREQVAAFVLDKHPLVAAILRRASEILEQWTGSPSITGYQRLEQDPDRPRQIMAAIYTAIAERKIPYSGPLTDGTEPSGQFARLPHDILDEEKGVFTCLDGCLLLCACALAAGLYPVMSFFSNHVITVIHLEPSFFSVPVIEGSDVIRKRLPQDLGGGNKINGSLLVIESTAMAAGHNASFEDAVVSAMRSLEERELDYTVDIMAARQAGVAALPVFVDDAGDYHICDDPEGVTEAAAPEAVDNVEPDEGETVVYTKPEQWMRRLLNLTMRNPLINSGFAKNHAIPLYCGNVQQLLEAMAGGGEYELCSKPGQQEIPKSFDALAAYGGDDELDLQQHRLRTPLEEEDVCKRAKELCKADKTSLEERGSGILYLTAGMLRWQESDSDKSAARYAPILLCPAELIRIGSRYKVRLREEEVQLNAALVEKIRQDFQVELPIWETLPTINGVVDVQKVLASFRRAVRDLQRWDVLKCVGLATFNFADFVLWRDIRENLPVLQENKLVDSLMDGYQKWESDSAAVDITDGEPLPVAVDSSQLAVIRLAENGETFVVQGPSGTGKSQCIVGVILQAMRKGMRVLLVAEKKAALDVVKKRLEALGLDDVCLMLHSTDTKKGQVLSQLGDVLDCAQQPEEENKAFESTAQALGEVKDELDAYVRALHSEGACGMTLYELLSAYEEMPPAGAENELCFGPDELAGAELLDAAGLKRRMDCLFRLSATAGAVGGGSGVGVGRLAGAEYSQKFKHKAETAVKNYQRALDALETAAHEFAVNCERAEGGDYAHLQTEIRLAKQVQELAAIPAAWKDNGALAEIVVPLRAAAEQAGRADKLRSMLLKTWHEEFLDEDCDGLIRQFNEMAASGPLKRRWRMELLAGRIKPLARVPVDPETLRTHLIKLREYQDCDADAQALLQGHKTVLRESFGEPPYDWDRVLTAAEQAERAEARLRSLGGDLRTRCLGNTRCEAAAADLTLCWEEASRHRDAMYELLDASPSQSGDNWIEEERTRCRLLARQVEMLKDWANFNRACAEAEAEGMGCVAAAYRRGEAAEQVNAAYRAALYRTLICHAIDSDSALSTFSGAVFNEQIERLRRLDKEVMQLARKEVHRQIYGRIRTVVDKAKQEGAELSSLKKAIRSKGRGLTLRKIFEQNLPLMQELCPCMLMSPHAVAQYLPMRSDLFDLVIFDEASQIPTSRAVGALARGKNAVVVGDCNQMPPTSFFTSTAVDEANLETEDLESVLDDCKALHVPEVALNRHYRSHESIIAFSNSRFYDNRLLTFPSARDRSSHVRLHLVENGVYDGGKTRRNPVEAAAVVEFLRSHCRDEERKDMSVGIITFNIQQQKLLEELVQEACRSDEVLRAWCDRAAEPMFIKNLENVQGDERDVILLSVNYGPDAKGKVSMNFGPLNGEGGWRRLNVAVTRARHWMEVFSSLVPEQIDLSRTNARGVHELRAFLEYAGGGRLPVNRRALRDMDAPGGVAESLCRGLESAGYEVVRHVGCSDLRVDVAVVHPRHPQQYVMGLLLDGGAYAGAGTTRDRELSQVDALRSQGWQIRRVWALDWFDNRDKELRAILRELEELCAAEDAV